MSDDQITEPTATVIDTDGIEDTTSVAGTENPIDFKKLLDEGFMAEGGEEVKATIDAAPEIIEAVQTEINPDMLRPRVALDMKLLDDTGSMSTRVGGISLIDMACQAHDRCLGVVSDITAMEPVSVLASAVWMNGPVQMGTAASDSNRVIYPYTPIAQAPRLAGTCVDLNGVTAWYDRYAEVLAGTLTQAAKLEEEHSKTVYGMIGLITDGMDNDSRTNNPTSLASIIHGVRRMKTIVPYVMYVGAMPKQNEPNYKTERDSALINLRIMGANIDNELAQARLVTLVKRIFTFVGFDPAMVFLPGQDPRAIVHAFVTISKMMVGVSKGQMPQGLTAV